ncbi:hypothetical protein [uncultured Winogradskyella sp.]|uniref:hypothetical protein n=1 Tax=uncultured Winogradskyella sp. TaxID=395353 RepID=UPI0030DA305B|tara:strand:- start:28415 stop:28627 length:213 start_codon:yes stop_codon:yes gene_type:complete
MKTIKHLPILILFISTSIYAQRFDKVEIKTTKLSEHTYMLEGAGGNIGVSVGDDGVFVIDDSLHHCLKKF